MKFLPKEIKKLKFKPRGEPETNIKYRLCRELERNGINFYMEYTHYGAGRLDIVIIKNKEIIGAIEIKRNSTNPDTWIKTSQGEGYLSLGIPIFLICHDYEFPEVIDFFREKIKKLNEQELFKKKNGK